MTDTASYDPNTMAGGSEVMEVMMTGGDGTEMNEDTLAQVVNMLQMEGQLTGGNQTIIIRQPGSNEIQMIQATSNGEEVIVSKASEADIQALQAGNGILAHVGQELLEGQHGQVVMMDEGGNLVEGMVQMHDSETHSDGEVVGMEQVSQLSQEAENILQDVKTNVTTHSAANVLGNFGSISSLQGHNFMSSSNKPITISTTTNKAKPQIPMHHSMSNGEVVSIKVNTGMKPKNILSTPKDTIKIATVTGQQKYKAPKFHKCVACSINFVSQVAYLNHMDSCPNNRKVAPLANKNITYTCVFCEKKFNSRLVLMQHVRTCDKAKSTKNLVGGGNASSKLRVTTSETKLGDISRKSAISKNVKMGKPKNVIVNKLRQEDTIRQLAMKKKGLGLLSNSESEISKHKYMESDSDDDKDIPYDDDEDLNDEDFEGDEVLEETLVSKQSQKHLGPIITRGMFKCRDCSRTFSKEYQYNRHVKGCTNAPLNASRIVDDSSIISGSTVVSVSASEAAALHYSGKRKRGKLDEDDAGSPSKKRISGPHIVSVNPKKVVSKTFHEKAKREYLQFSDNESDEEIMGYLSGSRKISKNINSYSNVHSSINKIVKISPTNKLVKQTGKAILSKMNQKVSKAIKDFPLCGLCGDKYKTNNDLIMHTKMSHSEDLLHVRDLLDGKGNLNYIKCPLCDLCFTSSSTLLCHLIATHEKDLKSVQDDLEIQNLNLQCPFCNAVSLTQGLHKEHIASKHLDKLIAKSSTNISPSAIDISTYLKEKNNGSLLPTSKLLVKQEKILCPDCGLFFLKSYFQHHKCASVNHSPSARKFICSELQCGDMTFYKLIHLLTHLQQVHEKSLSCENQSFETVNQFLEWLKKEENDSKMKYTRAMQRMKQGRLTSIWICHKFHNSMRDTANDHIEEIRKIDRLNQCYSRIHTETCFNKATSRYDGKTVIKYYPTHCHQRESVPAVTSKKPTEPVKEQKTVAAPLPEELPSLPPQYNSGEGVFSNAAELQQLLEDDDDFVSSNSKDNVNTSFDEQQLARFKEIAEESSSLPATNTEQELSEEKLPPPAEMLDQTPKIKDNSKPPNQPSVETPSVLETVSLQDVPSSLQNIVDDKGKEQKVDAGLVSLSDTDLLLEKMLGEHDGETEENEASSDKEATLASIPGDPPSTAVSIPSELQSLTPTEAKITDVDMLEAFGVNPAMSDCITSEENSRASTVSATVKDIESPSEVTNTPELQEATSSDFKQGENVEKDNENAQNSEEEDSDGEESTYVLPADIEEWNKLFELVRTQFSSESSSPEELSDAKMLLSYEDQILSIPIEKQVEIFNKLCLLANVQMT